MDVGSIYAFSAELQSILKHATAAPISNPVSKSIRATPVPRVNLPVPKVAM